MSQTRKSAQIKARTLASIVGRIISMGLAFGTISRFMTRSLYAVLESRCAWCEMLTLSSQAREELNFWSSSLGEYNSQPIWHTPSADRVVYTVASDTGYGGYVVEHADCVSSGNGLARKQGTAPHGVSYQQCGWFCKLLQKNC